jgi:general secretion pathway protein B
MEKPIKAISPQWSKMSKLNTGQLWQNTWPWLCWGSLPSIILMSGVALFETWQVDKVEPKRPIQLMSKISVISLPMSVDDKKAAEIVYLPMPRWQLETLPRRVTPNYVKVNRQNQTSTETTTASVKTKPEKKRIKEKAVEIPKSITPVIETNLNKDNVTSVDDTGWNVDQLDFTGMSDELIVQLKMAIADTQSGSLDEESIAKQMVKEAQSQDLQSDGVSLENIVSLYALPEDVKHSLPKIDLQTHLYSSVVEKRLIRVNGIDVAEGEIMAEGVMLEKIEPRQVIFWFDGHRIAMPALSEW